MDPVTGLMRGGRRDEDLNFEREAMEEGDLERGLSGIATENDPPTLEEIADEAVETAQTLMKLLGDKKLIALTSLSIADLSARMQVLTSLIESVQRKVEVVNDYEYSYRTDWRQSVLDTRRKRTSVAEDDAAAK